MVFFNIAAISLSMRFVTKHSNLALGILVAQLWILPTVSAQVRQPRASSFRLERTEAALTQRLYITVNGKERRISNVAVDAWLIDDGKSVAYSGLDGSGGFENEGQSLRIYNVRTRNTKKVLSEYTAVVAVMSTRTSTGQLAILVKLGDGGLGASYFAVVDPRRGEVFHRRWAELVELKGDRIKLAFYDENDWDAIHQERSNTSGEPEKVISPTSVKPKRFETHDLKRTLKRRVIHNKRLY